MTTARLTVVPDRRLRLIAYIRVSDEHGRGIDLRSPGIQRDAQDRWAAAHGHDIIEYIEDIDRTGRKWDGRQVEASVARIERGEADGIIVADWSRLARDTYDWSKAIHRVETKCGGIIVSATEGSAQGSTGEFTRDMFIALARMQSNKIRDAWMQTHAHRFAEGLPAHGSVPWCMTSAKRTVEIDPHRAEIVRELYRRYIDGAGAKALAGWLHEIGATGANGKPWQPQNILRMLDQPTHAGIVTYRGETRPAAFEAVIDADTFATYQAQRRYRAGHAQRPASPYLLSGLAVCGDCGHRLVGATAGRGKAPRLRCQYGRQARLHPSLDVSAPLVDAAVFDWLTAQTLDADITAAPVLAPPSTILAVTVQDIEKAIAKLDKEMTTLTRQLNAEIVSERDYANTRDAVNAERAQLVADLQAAADRVHLAPTVPIGTLARALVRDWSTLPIVECRAALRQMLKCVTVARLGGQLTVTPVPLAEII